MLALSARPVQTQPQNSTDGPGWFLDAAVKVKI
jgi:hypothetical protein